MHNDKNNCKNAVLTKLPRPSLNKTEKRLPIDAFKLLESEMVELKLAILSLERRIIMQPTPTPTTSSHTLFLTTTPSQTEPHPISQSQATQTDDIPQPNIPTNCEPPEAQNEDPVVSPNLTGAVQEESTTSSTTASSLPKTPEVIPDARKDETWFSGKKDALSNLFENNIRVFGRWYSSVEKAYQHKKAEYHNRWEIANNILRTDDSMEALKLGKKIKTFADWQIDRELIMLDILIAKATHCQRYRQSLLNSGNTTIHENTGHLYWGGQVGKNRLGQLHMRIRANMPPSAQDQELNSPCPRVPQNAPTQQHNPRPPHTSGMQPGRTRPQHNTATQQRPARLQRTTTMQHHNNTLPNKTTTRPPHGKPNQTTDSQPPPHNLVRDNKYQPKTTVTILGDSNTRHLNPDKMTQKVTINSHTCYTTDEVLLAATQGISSDITIIHSGTNDIKNKTPQEIVNTIKRTANLLLSHNRKVIISKLLPREGQHLNEVVRKTNALLMKTFQNQRSIYVTSARNFYHQGGPNVTLYKQEHKEGRKLPLLHLNASGIIVLSKELQRGIRTLNYAA